MPDGKPGDHPLTDIVVHRRPVYSPTVDALVRDIVELGGRGEIADLLLVEHNKPGRPDLSSLEAILRSVRDRLRQPGCTE
ncbi:MAG TPA: hypothetical protein VFU46_00730 [Gemmatimonadales bacterium]|nr:hypothetical protein [Gemmatimonadales bacterium]